jgi:hypothetical protein
MNDPGTLRDGSRQAWQAIWTFARLDGRGSCWLRKLMRVYICRACAPHTERCRHGRRIIGAEDHWRRLWR